MFTENWLFWSSALLYDVIVTSFRMFVLILVCIERKDPWLYFRTNKTYVEGSAFKFTGGEPSPIDKPVSYIVVS